MSNLASRLSALKSTQLNRQKLLDQLSKSLSAIEREAFEQVCRGAAMLEATMPGSIARLDEDSLNIQSPQECALAQVYGSFADAPMHLRDSNNSGFEGPTSARSLVSFTHLNDAWKRVIPIYRATA